MSEPLAKHHPEVQLRPTTFQGCFAQLHVPVSGTVSDAVVVMCPGIGRDGSTGHRPLRFLADQLALAGYRTLRFNYRGTGDSCDGDATLAAWQQNVHDAIDAALALDGARRVVLAGLRLGATLAAMVAAEQDAVAALILIEPVVRGRSFATQLRMEERLATKSEADAEGAVRVHGLQLPPEELAHIALLDLLTVDSDANRQILVLTTQHSEPMRQAQSAWQRQGAKVTQLVDESALAFLRPTHLADEPFPNLCPVVGWLSETCPARPLPVPEPVPRHRFDLAGPGWRETARMFGPAGNLFGMLCEPAVGLCNRILIFGNTGGDPHEGFARFGVELARHLARHGIASLRMDFAGLGDSIDASYDANAVTHTFMIDRRADFAAAIDLAESLGFRSIALHGLCSGAYHALQSAAADARVAALLCVNLPLFTIRYEKAGPASFARRSMETLSARGVRCGFIFADGDGGLVSLEQNFGSSGKDLAAYAGIECAIMPDIDHDLTRPEMRRRVADRIADFLAAVPTPTALADRPNFRGDTAKVPDARLHRNLATEGAL
ncbi:MAG: hypothetical protein HIU92_03175 [Proteobacteria bacterium]|nr:hypothetical protein [Pseudomonadota bacterium]